MIYIVLLIAGALLCNALPHLIKGLCGETFYTPWAKPRGAGRSSAVENFLWGAANLLVAGALLDRGLAGIVPHGLSVAAIGFVAAGLGLAVVFGRRQAG